MGGHHISVIHHHPPAMRLFGVPLFATFFQLVRGTDIPNALDCHDPEETGNVKECAQPIADVTAVAPRSSYIAKVKCVDCPFAPPGTGEGRKGRLPTGMLLVLLLDMAYTY